MTSLYRLLWAWSRVWRCHSSCGDATTHWGSFLLPLRREEEGEPVIRVVFYIKKQKQKTKQKKTSGHVRVRTLHPRQDLNSPPPSGFELSTPSGFELSTLVYTWISQSRYTACVKMICGYMIMSKTNNNNDKIRRQKSEHAGIQTLHPCIHL